jgi:Fe-Mn family superoxide dismutase
MDVVKKYELPPLKYGYKDLAPFLSEEQLMLHHDKHHAAYVNGANAILDKLAAARKDNVDLDMKAIEK